MLGEKNEESQQGADDSALSAEERPHCPLPHCPPPRWATGLRRVLYPDVAMDDAEADLPETPSGS